MALRDTSWIVDSHAIVESEEAQSQSLLFAFFGSTATYTRTINRIRKVWVALTEDAARAYKDSSGRAADTNTTWSMQEDNRIIGSYRLQADIDSTSEWTAV